MNTLNATPSTSELFIPDLNFRTLLVGSGDEYKHSHDFIEIFYVLKGEIKHCINDEVKTLSLGDICILKPNSTHSFKRIGDCLHRDLCFPKKFFKEVCDSLDKSIYPNIVENHNCLYSNLSIEELSYFEKRIASIVHLQTSTQINTLIRNLATACASLFIEKLGFIENPNSDTTLSDILSFFHKKDVIRGGLLELKKYIAFSDSYLCRTFKKHTGCTMLQYLNSIRLNYAATLLTSTNMSIQMIIDEIGFSSTRYFNKIFKSKYGISPSQYRKTATKNKSQ